LLIGIAVTTNEEVVQWWASPQSHLIFDNLNVTTDRYDILVPNDGHGPGLTCGIILNNHSNSDGTWHCKQPLIYSSIRRSLSISALMPHQLTRLKQIEFRANDQTFSVALMVYAPALVLSFIPNLLAIDQQMNGSLLQFGVAPLFRPITNFPSMNHTFHSVCSSGTLVCGIVKDDNEKNNNGSIYCFGESTQVGSRNYDRWMVHHGHSIPLCLSFITWPEV
jgi:hypothetical protein